jgi:DNA-binding HxlR family transcriptional regulator
MDAALKNGPDGSILSARIPTRHARWDGPGCPVEAALAVMDGKWKGVLLHHLLEEGALRFADLQRRTCGATPRVLSRALRDMVADGLVTRTVTPSVPPRVDYALTPRGQALRPAIAALRAWGAELLRQRAA